MYLLSSYAAHKIACARRFCIAYVLKNGSNNPGLTTKLVVATGALQYCVDLGATGNKGFNFLDVSVHKLWAESQRGHIRP